MITAGEIARALGKTIDFDLELSSVVTDSRKADKNHAFVALKGETMDGNLFVKSALENGAPLVVASYLPSHCDPKKVIVYEDTKKALLKIAGAYRRKFSIPLVGITGSVGKTTTREFIASVLKHEFKTLKNEENLNNEIGVSHTLLSLDETFEAAVMEMGMDGLGQIEEISNACYPQIAVITNIGVSHLEKLGSRENILKAKTEILKPMENGSALVLCADNDLLSKYENKNFNIYSYGIENKNAKVRAKDIVASNDSISFKIISPWGNLNAFIPIAGTHNVLNALAAFTVGSLMGIKGESIKKCLAEYETVGMRQKIIKKNGITFVADGYNCAPDSLNAAVKTLSEMNTNGKKIMIISDMLELGSETKLLHFECGKNMAESGIDAVFGYGELTESTIKGAKEKIKALHFENKSQLADYLKDSMKKDDILWFKASRGMKIEEVMEKLL